MDRNNEIVPVEGVSIAGMGAFGGQGMAPTTGVLMGVDNRDARMVAQSYPRNYKSFMDRFLAEAESMKAAALYSWRVNDKSSKEGDGKTTIEGASIKLAMAAARCYGNCVVMPSIADETPSSITVNAVFVDLETGFKCGRLFRQTFQGANFGKMDQARALDINFQIAQSKAIRNAILAAIPESAIDEAIRVAKNALIGPEPLRLLKPNEVEAIVKAFSDLGITKDQLVKRLGKTAWTATDKADLTVIYTSIKDKQTTVEAEFGDPTVVDAEPAEGEANDLNFGGEVEPSSRAKGR